MRPLDGPWPSFGRVRIERAAAVICETQERVANQKNVLPKALAAAGVDARSAPPQHPPRDPALGTASA